MTFRLPARVIGVTSLCEGKSSERIGTKHLFMYDFDEEPKEWVLEEAERLSKKWGIDIFVLRSSSRESPYDGHKESLHLISFDILTYRQVQSVQADVRLQSDYPLISERYWDKFLTLRVSHKGKKEPPVFVKAFINSSNFTKTNKKSLQHYLAYMGICGIPEPPSWYKELWKDVKILWVGYTTKHGLD